MANPVHAQQALIGAMLDAPGTWERRKMAPILLGSLMLFDSWDSVMIAFIMPTLSREWQLDPIVMGSLMSIGYAGQLIGAIAMGAMAERLGRKPIYGVAVVAMCLLSLACAAAQSVEQLAALRFIQGLAIGGAVPVCASYINEIAPTATRGRFFSVFQFLMISGYAIAAVASSLIVEQYGWRTMFLIGAAPLLILPFALVLLPESPRWLARAGRWEDALRSVRRLGGQVAARSTSDAPDESVPAPRSRISDLFARDVRGLVLTLVLLWFLTSLVNFGLTNWVPSIYVSVFDIPVSDALRFSALAVILVLFVPMLLGALMDRIGRRPLAIAGTLAGGLVLMSMVFAGSNIPVVVTLVALGHTGIGIGTVILWPYSAEAFPTRIRAMALGLCSAAARTASMLTPLLVGMLIATTGSVNPVFGLFGVLGLVVAAMWFFATRETAGVRIDEIAP